MQRNAAAPTLVFALAVESSQALHALMLRTRVLIDARRRRYAHDEQLRLGELFGEPARWADTLRAIPWSDVSVAVPGFERDTSVALSVACTSDMDVASS